MFRFNRAHVVLVHDTIMAALSFVAALYLRLGDDLPAYWHRGDLVLATGMFSVLAALVFLSQKLYRGVWRYASVRDLMALTRAATLTILLFMAVLFLVTRLDALPRAVLVINWFTLMALLGAPRLIYRSFKDRRLATKLLALGHRRIPVLLVGVGDEAELFIRATRAADAEYNPVGLVSERGARVGRNIHGVDVLGSMDEIVTVIEDLRRRKLAPQRLIITDHRLDGSVVRELLDHADRLGLPVARIPRLTDLKDGPSDKLTLRPIAVEDLLGRPQNVLDRGAMEAMITGRRVLVTGAGGSIGSELVRQVAGFAPSQLVLFDAGEFNLYAIDMELAGRGDGMDWQPVLGDVRDAARVRSVMAQFKPEVVFHAAALKHVPMVEYNPDEGVLTNAIGTRIVADACVDAGVRLMVQISTDKAVNPTNVMGASKRLAETYAQALDLAGTGTRFVTVRFGNVLGSTGSVVPLFQRQLAEGGPLTVTHPDMTRYFMTIREAVELVLQASAFGLDKPDLRGKIFVLDMGKPVRIVDLARQLIRLTGLRPEIDVKIVYTGLRPGEKLFEEIFHGAEPPLPTECKGILVAEPRAVDVVELGRSLDALENMCRAHRRDEVIAAIRELVPEYVPSGRALTAAQ
ncbi:MAG: polysaccharide biosynthesis protein [Rhodospirillaceae bacterium]|nr:polysaccharide biosynthesis protein [Rhodospirillales bacterium]